MFQVEPVLWLQSLESPFMTWLMTTVSQLGYTQVYVIVLIVLLFAVRLKESLFVFLTILICGILTGGLKDGLQFPRPSDIDSRVIEPGFERGPLIIDSGGAPDFWSFPPPAAMEAAKRQVDWSYGLPSGHVSLAAAFFLGLAFFFRSRGVFAFSVGWIILMALSRMYLGRHFIGDVLGGIVVGALAVAIAAYTVRPLRMSESPPVNMRALTRWGILSLLLLILAPFVDLLDKEDIGRILGLLATYACILWIGFPPDKAKIWKRVARVVLAVAVYLLLNPIIERIEDALLLSDNSFGLMIIVFTITFVPFIATVFIARRLRLYESW